MSNQDQAMSSVRPGMTIAERYRKLRPKVRQFVDRYLSTAGFNATEAARQCGYGSPQTLGPRLLKRYREIIEYKERDLREALSVSPREVVEGLSAIARDPQARHSDRTKAYEILARIHGMFSDTLKVELEPGALRRELSMAVEKLTLVLPPPEPAKSLPEPRVDIVEAEVSTIQHDAKVGHEQD